MRGKIKKDVLAAIKAAGRPLDITFETTRVKKHEAGDDGDDDGPEFKVDESEVTQSAAPGDGGRADEMEKKSEEEERKKKKAEEEEARKKKEEEEKKEKKNGGGGFFGGLFG